MLRKIYFMTALLFAGIAVASNSDMTEGPLASKSISDQNLSERYAEKGLELDKVFISFDHPAWTPEKLPLDVTTKFHDWWFEALRLYDANSAFIKDQRAPTAEEAEACAESFRLAFSAGALGHMYAAELAGKLLLEPRLNDHLSLIPSYESLPEEVRQWDIIRLVQPLIQDQGLRKCYERLVKLVLEIVDESNEDYPKVTILNPKKMQNECELILKDISTDLRSSDAMVLKLKIEFVMKSITTELRYSAFKRALSALMKDNSLIESCLFAHWLMQEYNDVEVTAETLLRCREYLAARLCPEFLEDLRGCIVEYGLDNKIEAEDLKALNQEKKSAEIIAAFLGKRGGVCLGGTYYYPEPDINSSEYKQTYSDRCLMFFLNHLILMRGNVDFSQMSDNSWRVHSAHLYSHQQLNPERVDRLEEYYKANDEK